CYMVSSPRLHRWLLNHPRFGPHIRSFQQRKAISLKVKIYSLLLAWANDRQRRLVRGRPAVGQAVIVGHSAGQDGLYVVDQDR
ncbi:MAG TPA: DUF454 domain-containing protein, partial [Chloroflexi bacterium]|nr:DUF454 domain-containing protein [Chloroflexota bacterium]